MVMDIGDETWGALAEGITEQLVIVATTAVIAAVVVSVMSKHRNDPRPWHRKVLDEAADMYNSL